MSSPTSSPTPPKGSVRSMISIFENQTDYVNNEPTNLVRRARSMVNLSYARPIKTKERIEPQLNLELTQIEQQIKHLQSNLSNNYRIYSRENHIYYQNQIIFVLTDLANVETRGDPKTIDKKSELTEILKRLNKKLNVLLPSEEGQVVTETVKYDKFGVRSRSTEEKRELKTKKEAVEVKINKKEAVVVQQRKEEHSKIVVQSEEREIEAKREKEDETDAAAVSVRSLKQLFEKKTNENEGKADFGYVPYSQKFKSQEVNGRALSIEKQNSFDADSSAVWKVTPASDDENIGERRGDLTPDSLTHEGSESSSSSDSDSEKIAKEDYEKE